MDQWHSKQLRLQVHEKPSSPMSKSNPIPTSNPNPNSNPMTRVQTASWPFFTSLAIPTSNPNPNSNPMTRVSTASWPFLTSLLLHFTMRTIRPVMQHLCACILWRNPLHTVGT